MRTSAQKCLCIPNWLGMLELSLVRESAGGIRESSDTCLPERGGSSRFQFGREKILYKTKSIR
jgi:hypothetical protein